MRWNLDDVFVKSFQSSGSADGAAADEFEFVERSETADEVPVEEVTFTYEPVRHVGGDDDHKDWIDILTMSPPITQDEHEVTFDISSFL